MSVWLFITLAVAGGLGAAARFLVDGLIRARVKLTYPVGTTVINVSGSLLLGLLTGLTIHGILPTEVQIIAGTGFLGGYTTFSTASFETVRLVQERRAGAALINGLGMLIASSALAAAGLGIGLVV